MAVFFFLPSEGGWPLVEVIIQEMGRGEFLLPYSCNWHRAVDCDDAKEALITERKRYETDLYRFTG